MASFIPGFLHNRGICDPGERRNAVREGEDIQFYFLTDPCGRLVQQYGYAIPRRLLNPVRRMPAGAFNGLRVEAILEPKGDTLRVKTLRLRLGSSATA